MRKRVREPFPPEHRQVLIRLISALSTIFKYTKEYVIPNLRLSFQAIQLSSSCTMFYPCVPCETCEVHAPRTPCGCITAPTRHATLPVRFPISDKSRGNRLRLFAARYFYLPLAQGGIISTPRTIIRSYGRTTVENDPPPWFFLMAIPEANSDTCPALTAFL